MTGHHVPPDDRTVDALVARRAAVQQEERRAALVERGTSRGACAPLPVDADAAYRERYGITPRRTP